MLAALLLAKHTKLPPQPEPFRWNISLLSSSERAHPATVLPDQIPAELFAQQTTPALPEHTAMPAVAAPHAMRPPLPSAILQPTNTGEVYQVTERDGSISFTNVPSDSRYRKMDIEPRPLGTMTRSAIAPMAPLTTSHSRAVVSSPSTKDGTGWLMETIVCRLKEHLEQARELYSGDQGRVVLKFMIYEDGSLGAVNVAQSSGRADLDQTAIEFMQRSAPFSFPRPLGQQFVSVLFPITFQGTSGGYAKLANPISCPLAHAQATKKTWP